MNMLSRLRNRFTTVYAIKDPIDELFQLNDTIEKYKARCKRIINFGLFIAMLYFSLVILSLLFTIFSVTNIFLLSQSFSTFYFIESGITLFFHLLSIPFSTIVIIFLLQTWKFYEVLVNRIHTIDKIWNDDSIMNLKDNGESNWNPIELNMFILGEMEEYISQVRKQIYISIIALSLTSFIVLIPAILYVIFNPIIINLNAIITMILPSIFLVVSLSYIPSLIELYRFITWQYKQFKIIHTVYSNPPPVSKTDEQDILSRLKSYLKKDDLLNDNAKVLFKKPFIIENETFDFGGKSKHNIVFVRKCKGIIPFSKEIQEFHSDIEKILSTHKTKPYYIRAILLCDWREEEGEFPDEVEEEIMKYPIKMRKNSSGDVITYIQIMMDNGSIYTMFPLIPEKKIS